MGCMIIQRAYKTKLRLTQQQERYFHGCAGASRFVYNWALADRIDAYKDDGTSINKFEQKRRFNGLKDELCPWIREYPYVIVERAFDDLDAAYKHFFRRVKQGGEKTGFPKFKSRHRSTPSFAMGKSGITVEADRIKLPRIGWVRLSERGYIPCVTYKHVTNGVKLNSATVSKRANNWYVSVQVEYEEDVKPTTGPPIGVDLGIKTLATVSNGAVYPNARAMQAALRKLARLQRELSRRGVRNEKGHLIRHTANSRKTVEKLQRAFQRVVDLRTHAQHNASAGIVATGASTIVLEDLNIRGMVTNHRLAGALSDAGMGELRRQIEYKAGWAGAEVLHADRWYPSSKTCSACGCIDSDLSLSDRVYRCRDCGLEIDRDLNAAINLAALGK